MSLAMRTTLNIDDDLLEAARELADRQRRSVGEVVSELMRKALAPGEAQERNGFLLLPKRGEGLVTLEHVNRLRDELP